MRNLFNRGAKTAPSQYPRIPFHLLRSLQLVSSIVVFSIMVYFSYHLRKDHYSIPWTFLWLMAASLLSVIALSFTIIVHLNVGLRPQINLAINGFLTALWLVSWGLLSWFMRGTLVSVCHIDSWKEEKGVMVCQIYKALFSFALFGVVSTIGALILDVFVFRSQNRRGAYRLQDLKSNPRPRPEATQGPYSDPEPGQANLNANYGNGGQETDRRVSETWEASPRPSMGPYNEKSESTMSEVGKERGEYAVPEGQFEYDTGYHGAPKTTV